MLYRVKGAILIGIFLTSIISWPRPTSVTYFPHTAAGDSAFDFFKQVVTFRPLQKIGNAIDVSLSFYAHINGLLTMFLVSITTSKDVVVLRDFLTLLTI